MLGFAGIALFFAIGLAVGVRLLRLWCATRRLPELLAGLGLLGIGPLGFCLLMTGNLLPGRTPLGETLRITGNFLQAFGFVAATTFTWRVFRPGSRWALAIAYFASAALFASAAGFALAPARSGAVSLQQHADVWIKTLCLGWGAFESIRYWHVTRRRVALGLADPLVSAAFLCWGVALAAGALGFVVIYVALLGLAPGEGIGAGVQLAMSLCGLVSAAGLYLAFLPPRPWARWIAARAAAQGAVA
jgi:hypothetical protein